MTQNTNSVFYDRISAELADIDAQGLTKPERVIASRQGPVISVNGRDVLNFCANNYLGLAGDERVTQAGIKAMEKWGAGTASVRFICGTLEIHKELERAIADYLGFEDTILFAAAFDANGGIFEPLFTEADAIVSDSLNHASIIDGVRLCKAKRYRFATSDMADLEAQLKQARADGAREIIIATDGAFSMDGYIAKLKDIRALADQYGALIMVDDCHATGFLGEKGRGSYAWNEVEVDFVTGTFGKALGGAMGGFICAKADVVALLKQRARPYLFSNALAPAVCGSSLEAIRIAAGEEGDALRAQLFANAARFRSAMTAAGFTLQPGEHPIIPVMLGDAKLAQDMAARMLELGVYVIGFSFPVVPRGQARIRTQMSAAHTFEQIDAAVAAFTTAGKELGVI
ncbi:glycine C-acetyltransferase [Brevundimonas pondensis]|uniref:2-amino-3-ketobutyrate coenzyme A ligase n=1 Tax=Brevundimonas pondensis TaxID=2774189 RepID=A0ABX7SGJ8_9CAUL|nr:glycine C-acetyltransferase [Brevundimonas pondensis]QTC86692.1 glycine C-acetyltransferase [Brevundimonas pondensis]